MDTLEWLNLDKVTKEQARKQFVNYRITVLNPGYGSPLFKYNDQYINECKDYSIPLNEVKNVIVKKYNLADWQFEIKTAFNNIELSLVIPKKYTNEQFILEDMNHCGYFLSKHNDISIHNYPYVICQYEPYYQESVKNDVLAMKVIVHISPKYNNESIKKNGFIPQHKNKAFLYPDRVYYIKGTVSITDIQELGSMLYNVDKIENKNNTGEYIIYWIDTSKLPDNIDFYYDPNYEHGLFTYDSIPYSCIISESPLNLK